MNLPLEPESPDPCEPPPRYPNRPRDAADARGTRPGASSVLGMMTKFWVPGEVKTRLGRSIGMSPAAELHRLFTTHLCRRLRHSAARRELCVSPDWRIPAVQAALAETDLRAHWSTVLQGEGDLGRRMTRWLTRNLTETHSHCILIGADCPTLGDHDIQLAIELLDRHDVVLGPALDGGYDLIGLRGPWDDRRRRLFQSIPWSGPDVLERTVDRAAADQLSLAQLPAAEDIDTLWELNRLIDRLRHSTSPSDGHLLGEIQRALESSHPIPPSQPDK